MPNADELEVIPEVAGLVVGGPLDPLSPLSPPPEGNVPPVAPSQVFYQGLSGEVKTPEDLKVYTKTLEDMLVQKAAHAVPPVASPLSVPVIPPNPNVPGNKERFAELIFSKPEEAFELAVSEAQSRMDKQRDTERNHQRFWNDFYVKNPDLAKVKSVVDSVLSQRNAEISVLQTESECEQFISKESRKMIVDVKKGLGFTETRVDSANAIALGGSGEPVPAAPIQPKAPKTFAQQISGLRPKGKARA